MSVRQDLIDAMVAYLVDQSTVLGQLLDPVAVRGYEFINKSYNTQLGEALVSIPDPPSVTRANAGNIDEVYTILVSARIYKRQHKEATGDFQTILGNIRDALTADFIANRATFWAYYTGAGGTALSTKFNSVELGPVETVIDEAIQNLRVNFVVYVNLTRSR